MSEAQSLEYELMTRTQSDNPEWHRLRKGRLTASNFKRVCSRRANFETLSVQLHASRYIQTAAMKHGLMGEPVAAEQYSKHFGHNVYRVGFVVNPTCCFLGCSPDRRVFDSDDIGNPWGLLEIKCTESTTVGNCNYLVTDATGIIRLKRSHDHYYQVMGQMGLTGSPWCDIFVSAKDDFHCERIYFDADFFTGMLSKLSDFFFNY